MKIKIQEIWVKCCPGFVKFKKILKENKILVVIILISLLPIYFFGVRPSQIRKGCSVTTKSTASYHDTNSAYNEETEMQKQKGLGDYIQCRNNNLVPEDQKVVPLDRPSKNAPSDEILHQVTVQGNFDPKAYIFFQTQLDTLSLDQLDQLVLGGLSSQAYVVYFYGNNGYIIDKPTYDDLKENKGKYPQCDFPQDFVEKYTNDPGYSYTTNASDAEYKSCLRKNGIEN